MLLTDLKFGKDKLFGVYIDGEFVCKLNDETVYKYNLKNGMEITDGFLDEIISVSQYQTVIRDGLRILSHSSNTRFGLLQKLKLKGHDSETIKEALHFFEEKGLLNDEVYAQSYVHDAVRLKKMGKVRIAFELRKKGISSDVIQSVTQDIDETENLKVIAEKEMAKLPCRDRKQIDKLKRRLYSKGYSIYDINDAIEEYIGGENVEI